MCFIMLKMNLDHAYNLTIILLNVKWLVIKVDKCKQSGILTYIQNTISVLLNYC
jgi:hypothetical protein